MDNSIAFIGLGNVGLPLAAVIADNGLAIIGVEIDAKRCMRINEGINPLREEDLFYDGKS
jgi:UDP-N-acetyl-D-mannosaminuronate dehydrogenase